MTHYIHRPTPPGGETDPRFRELTRVILHHDIIEAYSDVGWVEVISTGWMKSGTIWRRVPNNNAPTPELLALAEETRDGA